VPTDRWSRYRGAEHKKVLGQAIREGYAELFAVYPDANARSTSEIQNVFATSSNAGHQVISKTVATFKALVEQAEFDVEGQEEMSLPAGPLHTPAVTPQDAPAVTPQNEGNSGSVASAALHINIQIHISPEAGEDQIEKIFSSMAKHLYGRPVAA
jgi:hypothetical protein